MFIKLCSYVGIPIATEKTFGPLTTLSFAGIELDSALMEDCLPLDRLNRRSTLLLEFLRCKKATLREVQSLPGLLNFAYSVKKPGRAFLHRLIDLTVVIQCPHHLIQLSKDVNKDLKVWQSFLANFNARSFFLEETWYSSTKLDLYTDSSGALGFGAIFVSRWCFGKWPATWS